MSEKYFRRKLRSSSITTVVSISLVLFLLGLVGLLMLNSKMISDRVKENIRIQVILKEEVKEVDAEKFRKELDASRYVKSTEYINKDDAAKILKKELGDDFISFLGYNPLLASVDIRLKAEYASNDSITWIKKELQANENVHEIFYQESLVKTVNENIRKISLVLFAFAGLLMFIALALINNTIRLSIHSKRFLIKTMQLVGATEGFISRPFLFSGIRNGLYASLIAILSLIGLLYVAQREIPDLLQVQDNSLFLSVFGMVLALGMFISLISTWLAVRKYLHLKSDELYY